MPDYIELRSGNSPWMGVAHVIVTGLGVIAVSTTESAWEWKSGVLVLLAVTYYFTSRQFRTKAAPGKIRLFRDGSAVLSTDGVKIQAVRGLSGWASRWLCVIPFEHFSGGHLCRSIVCASANHPDDYRQLLVWLQMNNQQDTQRLIS